MHDSRIDQLAKQLIGYSVRLKKGEQILFDLHDVPAEAGISLIRAARAAGGIPFVNVHDARITREMQRGATEAQYDAIAEVQLRQIQQMDAYIAIRGSHNITENSDVTPDKMRLVMGRLRPVQNHRVNQTRWCVLRWPNAAMAQLAGMSTEAFEDFYFRVCLLDYAALLPAMKALEKLMNATKDVHIKGPGTDLRFSIKGIKSMACGGDKNIPDGECFTAPVKDSVEGVLSYNAPTIYQGIAFDNIRLEFSRGKIVKATANNTAAINRILDSDEGARYIGEFALGFNREILHPMRDILFDEKIAGSFHFTPGQAYEGPCDNGNRSQVHWDMVCIQRPDYGGGEIWFDGRLVRKDGQFTLPELMPLNWGTGTKPSRKSTRGKKS
ncbi:MAG: aminopeptidase [Verrucomicrobiales bacterium]|nr:aminopeptidase [Verrucomicrobiales bacterium]